MGSELRLCVSDRNSEKTFSRRQWFLDEFKTVPYVTITFQASTGLWSGLERLGYMHVFATNIISWIRTLTRETLEWHIRYQWDNQEVQENSTEAPTSK